jgi:hypothetical protein
MLKRLVGMLVASVWMSAVQAVPCLEPPKQIARDVIIDSQVRLAALRKLGTADLKNKTQVIVKPLLEQIPNMDKVTVIHMLTSQFCQLVSSNQIDDREKLDRFEVFSEQVHRILYGPTDPRASAPPVPVNQPVSTSSARAVPGGSKARTSPSSTFKSIGPGSDLKEVTEYLASRHPQWNKGKTYTASLTREVAGLKLTEEIAFDDEDKAISHSLSAKAVRTTGRSPKTVGPDPKNFCESVPPKLLQSLIEKLGAPTQPLVTASKAVPVDWTLLGYKGAPCHPISASTCSAESRVTTTNASFQLSGSTVSLEATLIEISHERAKTASSNVYEKSSRTCTVRIEDPAFVLLKVLDSSGSK